MCQKRKQISWSGLSFNCLAGHWATSGAWACCARLWWSDDERKVTLRVTFSLTKPIHLDIKAFLKTARLTLISSFLVNNTISVALTGIDHISSHATHEESTTAITGIHSVVPSGRNISAHFAQDFWFPFDRFLLLRGGVFAIHVSVFWRVR